MLGLRTRYYRSPPGGARLVAAATSADRRYCTAGQAERELPRYPHPPGSPAMPGIIDAGSRHASQAAGSQPETQ